MGEGWGRKGFGFWRAGEVGARKARMEAEDLPGGAGKRNQNKLRSNKRVRFQDEKGEEDETAAKKTINVTLLPADVKTHRDEIDIF